jgi:hypothetical protein
LSRLAEKVQASCPAAARAACGLTERKLSRFSDVTFKDLVAEARRLGTVVRRG